VLRLGVETTADLCFVTRIDLLDMGMAVVQQRKFMAGIRALVTENPLPPWGARPLE
jgi:hypothetical protein